MRAVDLRPRRPEPTRTLDHSPPVLPGADGQLPLRPKMTLG